MNKRQLGAAYERNAGEYLKTKGYEILQYNFRCRAGEIDIIARDGKYLVFVEVKYRKDMRAGSPAEAVNIRKQRIISRVASYYCFVHGYPEQTPCRFDVVSVCGGKIVLIKNAFDYQYK